MECVNSEVRNDFVGHNNSKLLVLKIKIHDQKLR